MISIFPNEHETFVRAESRDELLSKLEREIQKPFRGIRGVGLTGWIRGADFELTLQLRRHHLFMPVVTGSVEKTSKGAIIFLKYSLFAATRLLLLIWTVVLPVGGAIISYRSGNYGIISGALTFLVFLHVVAWSNFKLHVKTTQAVLHRVFD